MPDPFLTHESCILHLFFPRKPSFDPIGWTPQFLEKQATMKRVKKIPRKDFPSGGFSFAYRPDRDSNRRSLVLAT